MSTPSSSATAIAPETQPDGRELAETAADLIDEYLTQSAGEFQKSRRVNRAVSDLAHSLVKVAKEAGAEQGRVTIGDVSLELQENGSEEILSIRTDT